MPFVAEVRLGGEPLGNLRRLDMARRPYGQHTPYFECAEHDVCSLPHACNPLHVWFGLQ
ncbi:hypothetical protein NXC14_PA00049 (plasmid) [Rhizobium sp. NXC14]|nr:hypothetical protein NXC14_PA00049 [Rhizobium sp. NXC14]